MTRQHCKCEQAAKAGCGSAGHEEPAYSAHQSCRKSPKLLPEAEPVPTAQINSCLASFHGHSVSSSSSLLPSARCLLPPDLRHCRLCRPLEHAWGSTCVCLVFGGLFFFCFVFSPYWGSPSRLAPPCRKRPKSVCCAGCVIHVTVSSSFGLRKAKLYKAKLTQS